MPTTLSLRITAPAILLGPSYSLLTATLTGTNAASATGSISFTSTPGGISTTLPLVNGVATAGVAGTSTCALGITGDSVGVGTYSFVASYSGDANNASSSSNSVAWVVYPPTPAGFVRVYASNLTAGGVPVSGATISWAPVLPGEIPASFQEPGVGQAATTPYTAPVEGGAFSLLLPDTANTDPVLGFNVTLTDDESGDQLLGPGYGYVQPTNAPNSPWCSNGLANFDAYPLLLKGVVPVEYGPSAYDLYVEQGGKLTLAQWLDSLQGSNGKSVNFRGAFDPTLLYEPDDIATYQGSVWIALLPNGSNGSSSTNPATFPGANGSTATSFWALLVAAGASIQISQSFTGTPSSPQTLNFVHGLGTNNPQISTFCTAGTALFSNPVVVDANTVSITATSTCTIKAVFSFVAGIVAGSTPATPPTTTTISTGGGSNAALTSTVANFIAVLDPTTLVAQACQLTGFTVPFSSVPAGSTLEMAVFTGTPGNSTLFQTFTVTPTAGSTQQTFNVGADFAAVSRPANSYLGYVIPANGTGSAIPRYSSGGSTSFYFLFGSPVAVGSAYAFDANNGLIGIATTNTYTTPGSSGSAGMASGTGTVVYPQQASSTPAGTTGAAAPIVLAQSTLSANRTQLWAESFSGSGLPANWSQAGSGGWTVNNGLISPSGASAYQSGVTFARYFGVLRRTVRIKFQILTSGAAMAFASAQGTGNPGPWESIVVVDSSAGTVAIGNNYGGGAPSIAASQALGFPMTIGSNYSLLITLNERVITAAITDPITGSTATVTAGNNATDSGNCQYGVFEDYPQFLAVSGQYQVNSLTILANIANPRIYFGPGDSITYGFTLPLAQRWASLIAAQIGSSCIVSGRPGGITTGALGRMTSEVAYLQPYYMVLLIGTNDTVGGAAISLAQYESNTQAILAQAAAIGTKVVLCTLPCVAPASQSAVTAANNFLLAQASGVAAIVRFDLATSTNNDGTTQNSALFQSDNLHPNQAGSIAMANRFQVDAPFLFD